MKDLDELVEQYFYQMSYFRATPHWMKNEKKHLRSRCNYLFNQIQLLTGGKAAEAIEKRREELKK